MVAVVGNFCASVKISSVGALSSAEKVQTNEGAPYEVEAGKNEYTLSSHGSLLGILIKYKIGISA